MSFRHHPYQQKHGGQQNTDMRIAALEKTVHELQHQAAINRDLMSQLESHKQQIRKLFAISTERMRAFHVTAVHSSEKQFKSWERGTTEPLSQRG